MDPLIAAIVFEDSRKARLVSFSEQLLLLISFISGLQSDFYAHCEIYA